MLKRHDIIYKCKQFIDMLSDKMCDQISDAVLDAHLKQDPNAKVACGKLLIAQIIVIKMY
jgi:S-adenosylmethionine synthetase